MRFSIESTWSRSLSNDWLRPEKAMNFSVLEFYTDLEWTETVNAGLRNQSQRKSSMLQILKAEGVGQKPINILVQGISMHFLSYS